MVYDYRLLSLFNYCNYYLINLFIFVFCVLWRSNFHSFSFFYCVSPLFGRNIYIFISWKKASNFKFVFVLCCFLLQVCVNILRLLIFDTKKKIIIIIFNFWSIDFVNYLISRSNMVVNRTEDPPLNFFFFFCVHVLFSDNHYEFS